MNLREAATERRPGSGHPTATAGAADQRGSDRWHRARAVLGRIRGLQSEADPGTVLVGFRTYALVKDRVRAEPREPLTIKGAARPVEAWEILELSS